MGMIAYLRPVDETSIDELASYDDDQMAGFLYPEDESEVPLNLDKSWHAIHFLLCGTVEPQPSVPGSAVMGGAGIGPDLGYGPARWLSIEEVQAIAGELPERDELLDRYDSDELQAAEVYPDIWDEDHDVIKEYVGSNYDAMRGAFLEAAQGGKAMLLWIA